MRLVTRGQLDRVWTCEKCGRTDAEVRAAILSDGAEHMPEEFEWIDLGVSRRFIRAEPDQLTVLAAWCPDHVPYALRNGVDRELPSIPALARIKNRLLLKRGLAGLTKEQTRSLVSEEEQRLLGWD